MPEIMQKTEANVDIFNSARKKFDKCKYAENSPHFLGYCKLFHYTMDKSFDFLHYCANCRANTDNPTTSKIAARKK
jgi:hypothetical protein